MKNLVLLLVSFLFSIHYCNGQKITSSHYNYSGNNNLLYTELSGTTTNYVINTNEKKVKTYGKMRRTGIILTAVGVPLALGSTALIVSESRKDTGFFESDFKILLGAVGFVGGGVCTIAGTTLWAIGSKKMNQYKKTDNVSFDVGPNSFRVSYRF